MKKILLSLGTIVVASIPVVAVVSCSGINDKSDEKKKKNPVNNVNNGGSSQVGSTNNNQNSGSTSQTSSIGNVHNVVTQQVPTLVNHHQQLPTATGSHHTQIPTPVTGVVNTNVSQYDKIRASLQDFSSGNGHETTDVTENPHINGYLSDVGSNPRTFKVFNNGLFKIKVEKALIGANHPFSSNAKALLFAKNIANQINIGPAINDLPKGIQILNSTNAASLGGQAGVQVSLNASSGNAFSDRDILATTSLVVHEYGHHETMWDIQHLVSGTADEKYHRFIKDLNDDGYMSMSSVATSVLSRPRQNIGFAQGSMALYPSAYPIHPSYAPSVFSDKVYPFGFDELTTRIQNIISFRMSKDQAYKNGVIPAFLTSDMTFRHFSRDSVFASGKDSSRVEKIYRHLLKDVYGVGTETLSIIYDYNNSTLNGVTYNSFGSKNSLDSLQVFKNGVHVKTINLEKTKGLFGHKSELFSNTQTTKDVYDILSTPKVSNMGIHMNRSDSYTIKGFKGTTEVDISKISLNNATTAGGTWGSSYLTVEGNHLKIS